MALDLRGGQEATPAQADPWVVPGADPRVVGLASRAVSSLLSERRAGCATTEARLILLCDAFLAERDDMRHAMLRRMRRDGIGADDIVDRVVPEIARFLGRRWAEDDISFADVTIGTARLQETVRAMGLVDRTAGMGEAAQRAPAVARPRILAVMPRSEQHTLGVFVLADQLRRRGYAVDLALDRDPREVARMARTGRYAMVGISAAGRRTLASARELVDTIRASATRATPIVLGGSIVEGGADLKRMTGVDHVAGDVASALRGCGLDDREGVLTHAAS
jgi:methylmalonyl-CoA mutase cobalamin-binding domain/chain